MARLGEAYRQAEADLFGYLEERLAGTEDIRSSGAKPYVMRRFYELMRVLMRKTLKAGMQHQVVKGVQGFDERLVQIETGWIENEVVYQAGTGTKRLVRRRLGGEDLAFWNNPSVRRYIIGGVDAMDDILPELVQGGCTWENAGHPNDDNWII